MPRSMYCENCNTRLIELQVGDILHGFCNGKFGRDSYGDKTVVAIGSDWVLVSELSWNLREDTALRLYHVYQGDPQDLLEYLDPEVEDE